MENAMNAVLALYVIIGLAIGATWPVWLIIIFGQ
jgi:hypothetical protein